MADWAVNYLLATSRFLRMVITDRFVYVHMPKTGGTFVTEALKRLHAPGEDGTMRYGPITLDEPKHGTCRDIAREHRSKQIVSSIRSPYEWYVSQYEFAWWKRTFMYHPELYPTPAGAAIERALAGFERMYPEFPEISFEQFLRLCWDASLLFQYEPRLEVGLYTKSCVAFYFRDPNTALKRLNRSYISSNEYQSDMFDLRFIQTERLAEQLQEVLRAMGYTTADTLFISTLGRILPDGRGRSHDQHWEKYYTRDTKDLVRERDWVVFEMFPEFDVMGG